jgi:hypothetical protein
LGWKHRDYLRPAGGGTVVSEDEPLTGPQSGEQRYRLKYYTAEMSLRVPAGKGSYLEPSLEWTKRRSQERKDLAYDQYRANLDFIFKNKRQELRLKTNYYFRDYPDFLLKDNKGNLHYHYFGGAVDWKYGISKKIYLTTDLYATRRLSSRQDQTKLFNRSYFRAYGLLGVKVVF